MRYVQVLHIASSGLRVKLFDLICLNSLQTKEIKSLKTEGKRLFSDKLLFVLVSIGELFFGNYLRN